MIRPSFLLVDRVGELAPGRGARGELSAPADEALRACLALEAIGQLAAYAVMAADPTRRPIGGLARRVELGRDAAPGTRVELEATIERLDAEAALFSGSARGPDGAVAALVDAVGPLALAATLEDPRDARLRLERLRGADGPAPRRLAERLRIETDAADPRLARALVPAEALWLADHFPRRAVLPGALLLEAAADHGSAAASAILGARRRAVRALDVKMRRFVLPGETIELAADVSAGGGPVRLRASVGGQLVASATVETEPA